MLGRPLHVGTIGEGSVNYVIALIGIMASGNVAVPLDHQLNLEGLADCTNRSDVDILFYDLTHEPLISDILVFEEDDMIKCEVHPDYAYAEAAGIQNVLAAVTNIVNQHNKKMPSFKRIMQTSIRKAPFQKTTSKKIIRDAFFAERKRLKEHEPDHRLPENEVKRSIYELCIQVIGHRNFGLDTDLFTVGLDSFGSVLLLGDLEEKYGLSLTLADLMENSTVSKLEALYKERGGQKREERKVQERYPLTDNQKHMANTMPGNTSATLPYCFKLSNHIVGPLLTSARISPVTARGVSPSRHRHQV